MEISFSLETLLERDDVPSDAKIIIKGAIAYVSDKNSQTICVS